MLITVDRYESDHTATLSIIRIDGKRECYGLEDEYREKKVRGETRIPAGRYRIGLRKVGGFHKRYGKKFPWHEGMLHVLNVPNFQYILIHIGNFESNTNGCLLVGSSRSRVGDPLAVWSSGKAYKRLYQKVIKAAKAGRLSIEYLDYDRS